MSGAAAHAVASNFNAPVLSLKGQIKIFGIDFFYKHSTPNRIIFYKHFIPIGIKLYQIRFRYVISIGNRKLNFGYWRLKFIWNLIFGF